MKEIFTTGEAAEICKVSQQTIIRCFDNGRLRGFRVPGSRFRRIPRASLIAFMKEHGIPIEADDAAKRKVLIVGDRSINELLETLKKDPRVEVRRSVSAYEAGVATQDFAPEILVLGASLSPSEQIAICRSVRANPTLSRISIVALCAKPGDGEPLVTAGATTVLDAQTGSARIMEQLVLR